MYGVSEDIPVLSSPVVQKDISVRNRMCKTSSKVTSLCNVPESSNATIRAVYSRLRVVVSGHTEQAIPIQTQVRTSPYATSLEVMPLVSVFAAARCAFIVPKPKEDALSPDHNSASSLERSSCWHLDAQATEGPRYPDVMPSSRCWPPVDPEQPPLNWGFTVLDMHMGGCQN